MSHSEKHSEKEDKKLISSLKKIFGTVYFVQGTSSFSALSLFYYMKEVLLLGPVGGQVFSGLSYLAWFIKPLWGFISDRIKLFGYRRKSYFALMAFLALISWFTIGFFTYLEVHSVVLYLILFNFAMSGYAFVDVVTDALMVEYGQRLKKVGSFVNFQWTMLAVSSTIIALSSGFLQQLVLEHRQTGKGFVDYWLIFAATGIFPLLTAYVGLKHVPEPRDESQEKFYIRKIPLYLLKSIFFFAKLPLFLARMLPKLFSAIIKILAKTKGRKKIWLSFKKFRKENRHLWLLILFIVFWNFSPSVGYVSKMYFVDRLGFTPVIFGALSAVGAITWLISIIVYSWFVKRYPKIDWTRYLYVMVGLGCIGLALHYFYYLPPNHPWSFSINFPWGNILVTLEPLKKIWGLNFIWRAVKELSHWNRYHWWALVTDTTLGFASIPAFLIPLTICGQLTSTKNAGMTYAFLMSVSNMTGGFGSLVGGGLYKIFQAKHMAWFLIAFQKSFLNISKAPLSDERLLILQMFVYISAFFTFLAIPFIVMLKREVDRRKIDIYLSEK